MDGYSLRDVIYGIHHDVYQSYPKDSNTSINEDDVTVIDEDWLINRFMASDAELTAVDRRNRYWTSARWKTFDSSIGNNVHINPRPQFTRYCDIRSGARGITNDVTIMSTSGRYGMGRYYSEAIDDNTTTIFMEFGVPKFNSLINFFTKAVDGLSLRAAKTGRLPNKLAYYSAKAAGVGFMMLAFPLCTTLAWALKFGVSLLSNSGNAFSYYYLDKTMHTYWGSVNNIINQWANEAGLLSTIMKVDGAGSSSGSSSWLDKAKDYVKDELGLSSSKTGQARKIGFEYQIDNDDWNSLSEAFPDIFHKDQRYIDVFSIATRGQAIATRVKNLEHRMYQMGISSKTDFEGYVQKYNSKDEYRSPGSLLTDTMDSMLSVDKYLNDPYAKEEILNTVARAKNYTYDMFMSVLKSTGILAYEDDNSTSSNPNPNYNNNIGGGESTSKEDSKSIFSSIFSSGASSDNSKSGAGNEFLPDLTSGGYYSGDYVTEAELEEDRQRAEAYAQFVEDSTEYNNKGTTSTVDAVWRDGGMFAVFAVDYQGSVSESFSNSTGEIQIKDGIKSVAKGVQDIRFNFAGGNIQDDITNAISGIGDVVMGALEGVTLGFSNVIQTLLGAYVDMPLKWEDSSTSLPSASYKMRLISPYGNVISQLQNIYIPLAMLLAGTLPLQVGKWAYTSPFLCSLFNKGVQYIKLGMITSLSITRGTSNLPFSKNKRPLAIDVSFTVTDFSTMISTPMNAGMVGITDVFSPLIEDDTNMGRYIQTLASRDVLTNKYLGPKFRLLKNRIASNVGQWLSQDTWAFRVGEMLNQSPMSMFVNDMSLSTNQVGIMKQ